MNNNKNRIEEIQKQVKPVFESRKALCSKSFALDAYALGLIDGYNKAIKDIEEKMKSQ
jgi:hypothetical protein